MAAASAALADTPVLNVYTYDSFASKWGPGAAVKKAFEAQCACELNYVAADSSAGLLARILLEGPRSRADVVLGLDANFIADARAADLLVPHRVDTAKLDLPIAWDDQLFLPFDYGYFAFIYNAEKLAAPPRSFQELADADDSLKIIVQDPRSSTPGFGLLLWIKSLYGDAAPRVWRQLACKIVTVTQGWTEAYNLFLAGEADMVLSYTTSPAYHIIAEQEHKYRAAEFAEGHGLQIEVAAQLARAPQPELARQFMNFIVGEEFQTTIPTGNWMYPAVLPAAGLPAAFAELPRPTQALRLPPAEVAANKSAWVAEFTRALSE